MDRKYVTELLENLLNIYSPTGDTENAVCFMEDEFKKLNIPTRRTNKNALIATIEGETKDAITFSGHVDTLGLMVKEIKGNGRLAFSLVGGFSPTSVETENVFIKTYEGKLIAGTVLYNEASVHVYDTTTSATRSIKNMEIRIDEDVKNADDVKKLGISVGDFIYLDPRCRIYESGFIKSRHLDDKACIASMMGLAKYLVENKIKPKNTINFFISNYEEIGHGSSFIPENTVEFFAVDMAAPGVGQTSDEKAVTICAMDSSTPYDLGMRNTLRKIAEEKNIDYKIDIYPHYGSDATAALRAGHDIRCALIGPGVDASHSYERTHILGIENTFKLMLEYLLYK
ncbi:MAG: M42 family metallopeptidase [Peptoniphilaceae bacterium]|uniref:M42 family metallopeptidase n=2 Tax=Parvimonas sp. TaxID=1944660 RepID=UPI002A7537FE|nr:M42 family metallopeptidase [Parvimonas sp.]MDD7764236.1 M42 family metallopeptidase [Peptoniphilaceae bacterium]MDY3050442.1 M42 family metallopeptidase [Parvimonas sp.]